MAGSYNTEISDHDYAEIRLKASKNWLSAASVSLHKLDEVKVQMLSKDDQNMKRSRLGADMQVGHVDLKPPLADIQYQRTAWGSNSSINELIRRQTMRQKERPSSAKMAVNNRPPSGRKARPYSAKHENQSTIEKPKIAVHGEHYNASIRPPDSQRSTRSLSSVGGYNISEHKLENLHDGDKNASKNPHNSPACTPREKSPVANDVQQVYLEIPIPHLEADECAGKISELGQAVQDALAKEELNKVNGCNSTEPKSQLLRKPVPDSITIALPKTSMDLNEHLEFGIFTMEGINQDQTEKNNGIKTASTESIRKVEVDLDKLMNTNSKTHKSSSRPKTSHHGKRRSSNTKQSLHRSNHSDTSSLNKTAIPTVSLAYGMDESDQKSGQKKKKIIKGMDGDIETVMSQIDIDGDYDFSNDLQKMKLDKTIMKSSPVNNYSEKRHRGKYVTSDDHGQELFKTIKTLQLNEDGISETKLLSSLGTQLLPTRTIYVAPKPRPSSAKKVSSPQPRVKKVIRQPVLEHHANASKEVPYSVKRAVIQEHPASRKPDYVPESVLPSSDNQSVTRPASPPLIIVEEVKPQKKSHDDVDTFISMVDAPGDGDTNFLNVKQKQQPHSASVNSSKKRISKQITKNNGCNTNHHSKKNFHTNVTRPHTAVPKTAWSRQHDEETDEDEEDGLWSSRDEAWEHLDTEGIQHCREIQDHMIENGVPVSLGTLARLYYHPRNMNYIKFCHSEVWRREVIKTKLNFRKLVQDF